MKKKVLFCATVDYHFKAFHLPFMQWFQQHDWEVHVAANGTQTLPFIDRKYNIPIERTPMCLKNIKGFRELKSIIDQNNYDIIHCHTPMGGVLTRLAAYHARKRNTKVIYTAHGFHFYKGAPLLNWIAYYPIERWLARYTDCLITINEEDFSRAYHHKFKSGQIEHVHGVGVNTEIYRPVSDREKKDLRRKLGYSTDGFVLFYAAELNENKNQCLLIKSVAHLKKQIPHIKLLLAGNGPLLKNYQTFAIEEGVQNEVEFLGHRNNIHELLQMSDVAVASSNREGLPMNVAEAMACGLPLVVSRNRGHCELVNDGVNGYVITDSDHLVFSERLLTIFKSPQLRRSMGNESLNHVARYNLARVRAEMSEIYKQYM